MLCGQREAVGGLKYCNSALYKCLLPVLLTCIFRYQTLPEIADGIVELLSTLEKVCCRWGQNNRHGQLFLGLLVSCLVARCPKDPCHLNMDDNDLLMIMICCLRQCLLHIICNMPWNMCPEWWFATSMWTSTNVSIIPSLPVPFLLNNTMVCLFSGENTCIVYSSKCKNRMLMILLCAH